MLYRILALLALFFFTACGGRQEAPPLEPQDRRPVNEFGMPAPMQPAPETPVTPGKAPSRTVKIGLLVPLTGDAASAGTALQDAATLALMDKYGYSDSGEVKVVLVPKDTQGTPAGAAEAARAVLSSGAQLIVGPLFSQNVATVAPIAQQYGVNVLTFSNNPEVAGGNVFVFGFQVDQQVRRVLNYALNRDMRRVALLAPNSPYGKIVQSTAVQLMQASDLGLTSEQYYNPAGDAATEASQLAAFHANAPLDAVLIPEGGQKLEAIVSNLKRQGVTQPQMRYLGTGIWDEPTVLRSGVLTGGWFASSQPERFAAYDRRFREYFNYAPPRISALAYDAMALAASLAMTEQNDVFTAERLTDPVGYKGPVNGIFRCENNGICERGLAVLEVTGSGVAKVIDPAPESF